MKILFFLLKKESKFSIMKKLLVIAIILCLITNLSIAQISWLADEQMATAVAIQKDQLILMDFWATWCGPCKAMDKEMWNTEEFAKLSEKFVPFKINIDYNSELALRYGVKSIPHVVLATADGEVVWEKTGFSSSKPYKDALENLPTSLQGINSKLVEINKEYEEDKYFDIAISFQKLAGEASPDFKYDFYRLSDKYFKKISKESTKNEVIALAEMNQLLNDAYIGKHSRALRKLEKVEVGENSELKQFKYFIQAYCFKCDGNDEDYQLTKKEIKSEKYLAELDKN